MATVLDPGHEVALRSELLKICSAANIPGNGARLIKYTMNAVWAIDDLNLIIRMTPGRNAADAAARLVATTRLLHSAGAPVAPLADIDQPVSTGEWSATIWDQLPSLGDHALDPTSLVTPLRELHQIHMTSEVLPRWDIIGKIERRLAHVVSSSGDDRRFLEDVASRAVGEPLAELVAALTGKLGRAALQLAEPNWSLPFGVLHGDAHTGNLLRFGSRKVWCDLDSVCVGPAEWDLVPAAFGAVRFGRSRTDYDRFATAYGFDVTTSPMWPVLMELRDLQAVTSVLPQLHGRPNVADEVVRRLRCVLYGEIHTWNRYE